MFIQQVVADEEASNIYYKDVPSVEDSTQTDLTNRELVNLNLNLESCKHIIKRVLSYETLASNDKKTR